MKISPQKLAVKYKPPRLCLIYEADGQALFHDFPITGEVLEKPTNQVYETLKFENPGYLDEIEAVQVCGLIEKIKQNFIKERGSAIAEQNLKVSSVEKFRNLLDNLGITVESSDSSDEGHVDFNAVEKSFQNESDSEF